VIADHLGVLHGHQPHDRDGRNEDLGVRLIKVLVVRIPSASLNEETVDKGSIVRLLGSIDTLGVRDDLEVEHDGVNGDLVLSGIILHETSEETVSEMEARNPEARRMTVIDPALVLLESLHQVDYERCERLESIVAPLLPGLRHNVIEQLISHFFQFLTHNYFSLNTLLDVNQGRSNGPNQVVVTEQLLGKYGVHGLFVLNGMLLSGVFVVKSLRQLVKNTLCEIGQDLILCLGSSGNTSGLKRESDRQESVSGIDVRGNSSVGVHTKDLTIIINRKGLSEFNVAGLVSVTGDGVSSTLGQGVVLIVDHIWVEVVGQMELN
jgi:hypothetical protein